VSIASSLRELPREHLGLALALAGVLAFSLTLPMTRTAVRELDPWFLAFGRMSIAGIVAALWLIASGARRPGRAHLPLLAWASLGIVIGFPLLTSIAMQTIPANHGAVINGALPFATAVLAAWAFGERHHRRFWICAAVGSLMVVAFALRDGLAARGTLGLSTGDLAMIAAVLAGAVGYVAGGRAAGRIGGVATILWALVLALPLTLPATLLAVAQETPRAGLASWAAFAYVTLISQLVGFFAWYNGLALAGPGGIGRVGQVQLLQVFFTVGFAWLLFGEAVHPTTWLFALGVVATIALGRGPARVG
jgi:drug/metabolite transporter (DMT)-like permease